MSARRSPPTRSEPDKRSSARVQPDRPPPGQVRSLYADPLLYEHAFADRSADIAYFRNLAQAAGGPVLEYGCGSGRVTLPLAESGVAVVGVDQSASMLAVLSGRLRAHSPQVRERVTLHRADMRRLALAQRFPLVLSTFNVTAHLHRLRDMRAWLGRVREHLAPGGELVFDVALPAPEEVEADPDERHALPAFRHPETREWICHDERYEYDAATQVLVVESDHWLRGSADRFTTRIELRQWFPKELESLLKYEGFSVDLRADYTDMPVVMCQDTLIVRARLS